MPLRGMARRAGRAVTASTLLSQAGLHAAMPSEPGNAPARLRQSRDTFSCLVTSCAARNASNGGALDRAPVRAGFHRAARQRPQRALGAGRRRVWRATAPLRPVSYPIHLKLSAAEASADRGRVEQRLPSHGHEKGRSAALPRRRRAARERQPHSQLGRAQQSIERAALPANHGRPRRDRQVRLAPH